MGIDDWREQMADGVEDLKKCNEQWKKELRKAFRSWIESVRYRIRNLKSRTEGQIAEIKGEANQGAKSHDGDEDASGQSEHAEDLLGDTGGVDNEAEADNGS